MQSGWKRILGAVLVVGIFATGAAHATLVGDSVSGVLFNGVNSSGSVNAQFNSTSTVGTGIEFEGQWTYGDFGTTWGINADLGASSLTVSVAHIFGVTNLSTGGINSLFGITLGDLDPGGDIIGITETSGNHSKNISFTQNSITLIWDAVDIFRPELLKGPIWTFEIIRSNQRTVPEPSSLALFSLGLLGLLMARKQS